MTLISNVSLPVAALVLCVAAQIPCFAETAEASKSAPKPQTWTFRSRLSVSSSDVKSGWSITQGDSDQNEIASFALRENNKETLDRKSVV